MLLQEHCAFQTMADINLGSIGLKHEGYLQLCRQPWLEQRPVQQQVQQGWGRCSA